MLKHLGPRLRYLHCCSDQAINNALGEMELTSAQGHILVYLSHRKDSPCPRDIEEFFGLSHPTVSGLLNRLEKKEFIAIRPDQQDKRCKRIYLLPKGEACHQKLHQTIQSTEETMIRDFTPEELEQFTRLLDRAIENMGGSFHCPDHKEESNQ